MKDRLKKAKDAIKLHAPAIISTVLVTSIGTIIYTHMRKEVWNAYILDQRQRDLMARDADAVVAFADQKVLILGKPWNPDK